MLDANKILKIVDRVRSAYAAKDRELAQLEQELKKSLVPGPMRKRQNLKQARIEHYEQVYTTGTFRKPANAKRK